MGHRDLYHRFESYFQNYVNDVISFSLINGTNSIRIKLTNNREFIFSYKNARDWRLETANSFIKTSKEKNE